MSSLLKIVLAQLTVGLDAPVIVFLFVAFIVVANLISKHLAMKHERALKLGEAQKASWPIGAIAIFPVLAALMFFWVSGGIQHLSVLGVVFIFVAFIVVANLTSKHFTMKHELALKHGKPPEAPVPQKHEQEKAGMSYGMKVGILFLLASAVPLAAILLLFISIDSPTYHAAVDVVVDGPHPFPPKSISSWTEDLPFDADQYPSIEACAAPLARQIVEQIRVSQESEMAAEATAEEKYPSTNSTPLRISHSGFSDKDYSDFIEALEKAFKSLKPPVFVANGEADNTRSVSFSLKNLKRFEDAYPTKPIRLKSGDISVSWSKLDGNVLDLSKETKSVSFIEKPWLTDFQNFTRQYPESRFYVGAPTRVQPLKSKAHEHAVQDVAERLNLKAEQIEPRIAGKFTQTIERPYGKVYREAILVQDPPPSPVQYIAESLPVSRSRGLHKPSPPSFEFSLAMIVCLTVVAGFISNIATQGYYRTGISRSVMIVAAVSAILIILIVVTTVA